MIFERVEQATVSLTKLGGRGVLVPGGFILTAAHCITWNGVGGMVLGDLFTEDIVTRNDSRFKVQLLAADPVSDLAVLGALDDQVFPADCDSFRRWQEVANGVPLRPTVPRPHRPLSVRVFTHKETWVHGVITRHGEQVGPMMWMDNVEIIEPGTSGSPVVDSAGSLVGIVSNINIPLAEEKQNGTVPIVRLALPGWALSVVTRAQSEPKQSAAVVANLRRERRVTISKASEAFREETVFAHAVPGRNCGRGGTANLDSRGR